MTRILTPPGRVNIVWVERFAVEIEKMIPVKDKMRFVKTLIPLGVALFLLGGCAVCSDCGAIRKRHEVTTIFTSSTVVPGYNYFYNGEILYPKAIMGVDKGLALEGTFWTPIELTQEQLTRWVTDIDRRPGNNLAAGVNGRFAGFEILDPQGRRVGVWYSNFDWGVFKFPEENKIVAYCPSVKPGSGSFSYNIRN